MVVGAAAVLRARRRHSLRLSSRRRRLEHPSHAHIVGGAEWLFGARRARSHVARPVERGMAGWTCEEGRRGRGPGAGGHPDRQHGRRLAPTARRAPSGGRHRGGGHAASCPAARSAGGRDRGPRGVLLRRERGAAERRHWSTSSRPVSACCWSPTPGCRRCRIPATGWSSPLSSTGFSVTAVPGPSAVLAALAVSGYRSTGSASRGSCPARAANAHDGWPSWPPNLGRWCSSRHRTERRRPWPPWSSASAAIVVERSAGS